MEWSNLWARRRISVSFSSNFIFIRTVQIEQQFRRRKFLPKWRKSSSKNLGFCFMLAIGIPFDLYSVLNFSVVFCQTKVQSWAKASSICPKDQHIVITCVSKANISVVHIVSLHIDCCIPSVHRLECETNFNCSILDSVWVQWAVAALKTKPIFVEDHLRQRQSRQNKYSLSTNSMSKCYENLSKLNFDIELNWIWIKMRMFIE